MEAYKLLVLLDIPLFKINSSSFWANGVGGGHTNVKIVNVDVLPKVGDNLCYLP